MNLALLHKRLGFSKQSSMFFNYLCKLVYSFKKVVKGYFKVQTNVG
jgi:hypothetical protein